MPLNLSTANCRFDRSNVDFPHRHHRIKRSFGGYAIRTGVCFRQDNRRNLPRNTPLVFAPAALALLTAIADDCVPVAVRFALVFGCNLERECFVVLERRSAVEPEARNTQHGELDSQYVPFFPRWIICWCAMHYPDRRVRKCFGVESRSTLGVVFVPEADRVLCNLCHFISPLIVVVTRFRTASTCFG